MNFKLLRQKNQKEFLKSGAEIEVGSLENLPFDISFLKNITAQSDEIIQVLSSGLTAIVYKICVDKRVYCLKKKRDNILVQNIDGQTSFLNEVQRRRDFYALKKNYPDQFGNIVNTVYASLNHGIILSEWIEGEIISTFNQRNIKSIFKTLFEVEKAGLFECDLSAPNIIVDNNDEVHFFDFGYMYPYNPLVHYNSDGKCNPVFHLAERLETRSLIQYLIDLESVDTTKALNAFKTEKQEAINIYVEKLKWLELLKADNEIITWQRKFIDDWEHGLMSV